MLPLTIKSWFNLKELSGSLGDLGLFIPLVVAMTIVGKLDLGVILICAGAMNILTGLIFRQPIPVQPMKVIAVVVISEGLLPEEMVAAGMFMGITMLFLSVFIDRINSYIPKVVVRGIQFGVGVKLALKGIASIGSLPLMGWDSMLAAVVITGILLILLFKDIPGLLFVFLFGFALQYLQLRQDFPSLMFNWPDFHLHWPTRVGWLSGLVQGALPQLPLTLLNSVIAVCALSTNYFPGKGIAPKKVAASVGCAYLWERFPCAMVLAAWRPSIVSAPELAVAW